MPGTTLPRGNVLVIKAFALTLAPAQVAANITAEQTFACVGTQPGDYINANSLVAQTAGLFISNVRVVTADTVTIAFGNLTGGALTPAPGVYECVLGRAEQPIATDAT